MLGTALTHGKIQGVVFLSLGYGCMDLMLPSAWAISMDLGAQYAGAVSGAMNSAGQLGGFTSSVLFGYLVRMTTNYNAPLFAIACMMAVAAFLFTRIDSSRPVIEHATEIVNLIEERGPGAK